jgi:hypothetical protein
VLIGCAPECLTLPFFGTLSDRIGHGSVYGGCGSAVAFMAAIAVLSAACAFALKPLRSA